MSSISTRPAAFAPASEHSVLTEPGMRLGDSLTIGWTSSLIGIVEARGASGEFETPATPDQTLVVVTKGRMRLDAFDKGTWRSALRDTGSVGLTPGGCQNRLRWTALGATDSFETAHIFLPQIILANAADELRRSGESVRSEPADALAIDDPLTTNLALSLVTAFRSRESDLLASAIAQALAIRLVSMENGWAKKIRQPYTGSLRGARLERLLEFMRVHCSHELSLDKLAAEAGLSRFQLIRAFKRSVGTSPHRHLTELRLEKAAKLLGEADRSVADVATACGFSSAAHLAKAFYGRYKQTPSTFINRASDDRGKRRYNPSIRS